MIVMKRRDPIDIEQCIGCGTDVSVYSERQRIDGETFCSRCRRLHTARVRSRKEATSLVRLAALTPRVTTDPKICECEEPRDPERLGWCVTCFQDIAGKQ